MVTGKRRTSSSVFQAVRTPNLWVLVPDGSAKSAREVASDLGRHPGGWIHLQKWSVKASAQGKGLWRQFGRAAKLRSEVNMEDGEKSQGESLRNGEGTDELQGCCMGWVWKSEFEVGLCALFWGHRRQVGWGYLHPLGVLKCGLRVSWRRVRVERIEERSRGLL